MAVSAECGLSIGGISRACYNYSKSAGAGQLWFLTVSKLEFTLHPQEIILSFSVSCCKYSSGVSPTPNRTAPWAPKPTWGGGHLILCGRLLFASCFWFGFFFFQGQLCSWRENVNRQSHCATRPCQLAVQPRCGCRRPHKHRYVMG